MKLHTIRVLGLLLACGLAGRPQTPPAQPGQVAMPAATGPSQVGNGSISPNDQLAPLQTVGQHWKLFLNETFGPLSLGGTIFNSLFSQVTNSDPLYGTGATAFGQRVGASAADIAAQNFFGDFLVASVFHEDPRYIRLGEGHSFGRRFGYAISRAFVIRKSSGRNGFNWDNLLGSGASAVFSNLYYPLPSRTRDAILIHLGTDIADNGFVNLAPEFWPDFKRHFFGRHRR